MWEIISSFAAIFKLRIFSACRPTMWAQHKDRPQYYSEIIVINRDDTADRIQDAANEARLPSYNGRNPPPAFRSASPIRIAEHFREAYFLWSDINENADPDVRTDMDRILDHIVPENEPYYTHTMEGADDMPAHAKSSLMGVSLTVPITNGRLNLGTWQGIYLCEFRDYGGSRSIVLTVYS